MISMRSLESGYMNIWKKLQLTSLVMLFGTVLRREVVVVFWFFKWDFAISYIPLILGEKQCILATSIDTPHFTKAMIVLKVISKRILALSGSLSVHSFHKQ